MGGLFTSYLLVIPVEAISKGKRYGKPPAELLYPPLMVFMSSGITMKPFGSLELNFTNHLYNKYALLAFFGAVSPFFAVENSMYLLTGKGLFSSELSSGS